MKRIDLCPLSQNRAWKGRRFSTKEKTIFEKKFREALIGTEIDEYDLYSIRFIFHTIKAQDLDNNLKTCIDILAKFYGFNDNRIMRIIAEKVICKKGSEYIEVEIEEYK